MKTRDTQFYSDGILLKGTLYLPDGDIDDAAPLLVACSGFLGLNNIHPARFARALTPAGIPCFGFDYRGFKPSEGQPGHVLLDEQIRDIRNAATFAQTLEAVRGRNLVLLGWGMGGGLILQAAQGLSQLRGLICVNGFYDGQRVQQTVRGEDDYQRFLRWVVDERQAAVHSPEPNLVDPFDIYPLDPVTRDYVDNVLRKNPDFGGKVETSLADSLLGFAPERHLSVLEKIPLLIAHGDENALHPPQEARSLYEQHRGDKELYWIEGGGHTEWMLDDNPLFQGLAQHISGWLKQRQ